MLTPDERTIVIVGGVAGGATAATRARRCNEKARIIIYEKDGYASFANCGLPYYLGGEIADREKLLVAKPETFSKRYNIELRTRHEVTRIDAEARVVSVLDRDTGNEFTQPYDRLILAPGASPIVPPIEGATSPNVLTLRNMEDTDRIDAFIETSCPRRAAVIGAGFIGLEMAEQLRHRGMEVTVIELADQVLPPLDPEMAVFVREELEANGVTVKLSDGVKAFQMDDGKVGAVVLNSGAAVPADMVIMSIGVRPMTELARAAGLDMEEAGGIRVNEYMQTSRSEIYAVGDAVAYQHGVTCKPMRVALAGPANRAGRIAGEHAATDRSEPMPPVLGTAIIRVFGKTAALTGLTMKAAAREGIAAKEAVITAGHHAGYFPGAQSMTLKLVYCPETGRLLGAQAVGGDGVDKRIDVIATAIHFGGNVRHLAGLDLCYAPPFGSARDPVHVAAFVAVNDLDERSPTAPATVKVGGAQLLDVRNAAELALCCRPEAVNIPVDELRERIGELDPSRETLVTCQSGLRGHVATCVLKQHGFENVKNITGGMLLQQRACPERLVKS